MQTYLVRSDEGSQVPIFQIGSVYVSRRAMVELLKSVVGVTNVRLGKSVREPSDILIRFDFQGVPFMIWEPFGDNSRYWIGPADMVDGEPDVPLAPDIAPLVEAFNRYEPSFARSILGSLVTLDFIRRVLR